MLGNGTWLFLYTIGQAEERHPSTAPLHIKDQEQQVKDQGCLCSAEKSVRFSLPSKKATSTSRNDNQGSFESLHRSNINSDRKYNGNTLHGNDSGSSTHICCTGKL